MLRICLTVLIMAGSVFCTKADDAKPPIVGISISPSESSFTYGAYVIWKLTITNLTSNPIILPSFNYLASGKRFYGEAEKYVNDYILNLELNHGGNKISRKYPPAIASRMAGKYLTKELPPEGVINLELQISSYFDMTNGEYSFAVTLDTTSCKDATITKGVWVSPPVTLHIAPRLTFRARKPEESLEQYAQSRVAFFLKASTPDFDGRPLYFPEIQSTKGDVPALIELIDSPDKEVASSTLELLRWTGGYGDEGKPPASQSKAAWEEWWQKTGSKMSDSKLWERTLIQ